jgi:hypothetical protein
MEQLRQGDVLLMPLSSAPTRWGVNTNDVKSVDDERALKGRGKVILEGEITDHIHLLPEYDDTVFMENEKGDLIIRTNSDTELRHDCPGQAKPDHDTIPVEMGEYLFVPQCEWLAGNVRQVKD